jgi:hypothetical protein
VAGYNGKDEGNGSVHASPPVQADTISEALEAIAMAAVELRGAANEAGAAISSLANRLERAEREIETVNDAVVDLRGVRTELRTFSEQIGMLNENVLRNLRSDLDRERRLGEIQTSLAREAARTGALAGAKLSTIVTVTISLLWLAAWLWATHTGNASPPRPL